jgi:hypothetical protein
MHDVTQCASWSDFLVSISPAVTGLLSATALWVASRARSTSKDAHATSRAALTISREHSLGSSVIVAADVVEALKKRSLKGEDRNG